MDYSGKIIKKTPVVPSQTSASGVWTLDDALQATKSNTWPVANVPDPISRSLRFRSSASAYLNRTPASAGNRQIWTWSGWVKRGQLGAQQKIFFAGASGTNFASFEFISGDNFQLFSYVGTTDAYLISSQVFRDPSAWYHLVVAVDTTQATASNRIKVYVNGTQITAFSTATYPAQNYNFPINSAVAHTIGRDNANANNYFDGYLAETYLIDGQQLAPSSFGGTNAVTGVWEPRPYTGTYGTNGFLLTFSDNTSTTTLGNDTSGNSNNWTTNNISLTAGSTYDSMLDVPTQWIGYNTGDVASVTRGNYAVFNPLKSFSAGLPTFSQANLQISESASTTRQVLGTIGFNSGKFYWETTITASVTAGDFLLGIINDTQFASNTVNSGGYYRGNGQIANLTGTLQTSGSTYTTNDIIGIAVDATAGTVQFYKNNVAQGATPSFTFTAGTLVYPSFFIDNNLGSKILSVNFGQRPFSYTPPAGFLSLCTTNLPSPTILQGDDYFNAVLWTGNGASTIDVTGVGFQPDFVWAKRRSASDGHGLFDVVRGTNQWLQSNTTGAETTFGGNFGLLAFNSDGFQMGNGSSVNASGATYVGWNWKANGAGVSNTAGSITSTVSANTTAGFSIVTYTAPASGAFTVGHGLGVAPAMIITKSRSNSGYVWGTYHQSIGNTGRVDLNSTAATVTSLNGAWNNTSPTSTVFSVGLDWAGSGITYVAYCFAAVAGYSAFGSYTGNGSTNGPFVYLGFRPRYIMVKRTTGASDWFIMDTARNTYNEATTALFADLTNADYTLTTGGFDILSNGFKLRVGSDFNPNTNGETFIYMAFAENPFKNALAR